MTGCWQKIPVKIMSHLNDGYVKSVEFEIKQHEELVKDFYYKRTKRDRNSLCTTSPESKCKEIQVFVSVANCTSTWMEAKS